MTKSIVHLCFASCITSWSTVDSLSFTNGSTPADDRLVGPGGLSSHPRRLTVPRPEVGRERETLPQGKPWQADVVEHQHANCLVAIVVKCCCEHILLYAVVWFRLLILLDHSAWKRQLTFKLLAGGAKCLRNKLRWTFCGRVSVRLGISVGLGASCCSRMRSMK